MKTMSTSLMKSSLVLFFASFLLIQGILGEMECDDLPTYLCAFSIASSGKRCLLENYENGFGRVEYQCRTSEVIVDGISDYIETDDCIFTCGVDRNITGISSDALHEPHTTFKLCSKDCYQNCPNIVDLYFNLAAGEGVYFPELCEKQKFNPHRAMIDLLSSNVAPGPISGEHSGYLIAPGPIPTKLSGYLTATAPAPMFY